MMTMGSQCGHTCFVKHRSLQSYTITMSVSIFKFINNLLHSDVINVIFQFYNKATHTHKNIHVLIQYEMHYSEFLFQYISVMFERPELPLENLFIFSQQNHFCANRKALYPGIAQQIYKERRKVENVASLRLEICYILTGELKHLQCSP